MRKPHPDVLPGHSGITNLNAGTKDKGIATRSFSALTEFVGPARGRRCGPMGAWAGKLERPCPNMDHARSLAPGPRFQPANIRNIVLAFFRRHDHRGARQEVIDWLFTILLEHGAVMCDCTHTFRYEGDWGMKGLRRAFAYSIVSMLFFFVLNPAYADVTGSLSGVVRDHAQAVVVGAKITITNSQTNLSQSTLSSDDGSYHFLALTAGSYKITATWPGSGLTRRTRSRFR